MGASVKGYSLEPPTSPNLYDAARIFEKVDSQFGDIRNLENLKSSIVSFNPDILIHMAAQPLVRLSYRMPVETYDTNVMGTVNVLEAARYCSSLKAIVSVTTDKCYDNKEWYWGYREDDPMGGYDPYSSSKGCVELITAAYRKSFMREMSIGLASARAGNVIGGGDWAEDRLIPDILRAFERNEKVTIRNHMSIRPWQHVLEPLSGYLLLAQNLYINPHEYSEAWNFGPNDDDSRTVEWIINYMVGKWPGASWEKDNALNVHEAGYLKLDISKAKARLKWKPTWRLESTIDRIINWHRLWLLNEDMQRECIVEINEFMKDINYEID